MTKKPISNQEIAAILRGVGEYLAMQNVPWKPQAYERAALGVEEMDRELGDIYKEAGAKALLGVPGVGRGIADHIEELLKTGKLKYYDSLRKEVPVDVAGLSRVEGLGPKSIRKLYELLKVRNLKDLEKAAAAGKVRELKGFGQKAEEKILKGIEFAKTVGVRFRLGQVVSQVASLVKRLQALDGVEQAVAAGSYRRRKETVGDVDLLVVSGRPEDVMRNFVKVPGVVRILAEGGTKSSVRLASGLQVDLRVVPKESYGAALNYFTGSKEHNVALRQLAVGRGWKLNEYGLFKGTRRIAGATEEELYAKFGMDYVEPELRENTGEIEAARRRALPKILGYGDLMGDLQVQTDWTDGSASIEAMARAAAARGLSYIAITDHTKRLAMTNGLDEARLLKQMAEIDRVNRKLKGKITILKGTECDILKDGTLDIEDKVLAKLDVVGVSVHSHFNLPRQEQTERVLRAMRNPHADILFHPTGRIIGRRAPIELDMDRVIAEAKKRKMVLEANSYPDRLDLRDAHIRAAVAAGVKLAVDSDAHAPEHFPLLEFGIAQARRGWATRDDVVNAWPVAKMKACLRKDG